jgi:hypothetical protein
MSDERKAVRSLNLREAGTWYEPDYMPVGPAGTRQNWEFSQLRYSSSQNSLRGLRPTA